MFLVVATAPIDANWQERDKRMCRAVGRRSDSNMADHKHREHVWQVPMFDDAVRMRKRLVEVDMVNAWVREA